MKDGPVCFLLNMQFNALTAHLVGSVMQQFCLLIVSFLIYVVSGCSVV